VYSRCGFRLVKISIPCRPVNLVVSPLSRIIGNIYVRLQILIGAQGLIRETINLKEKCMRVFCFKQLKCILANHLTSSFWFVFIYSSIYLFRVALRIIPSNWVCPFEGEMNPRVKRKNDFLNSRMLSTLSVNTTLYYYYYYWY
jgi:hypothetical protein